MKIHVPEDLGGKLRVLPEDTYNAQIQDMFFGMSKTNNPKITCKWVITSESDQNPEGDPPTTGENVLETFSLQPKAIWNLNDLYTEVTGNRLPKGDFSPEEFTEMVKQELIGAELLIDVITDTGSGSERSQIVNRTM